MREIQPLEHTPYLLKTLPRAFFNTQCMSKHMKQNVNQATQKNVENIHTWCYYVYQDSSNMLKTV